MKYQYLFIDNDDTLMDFLASEYECIGKTLRQYGLDDSDSTRKTYSAINKDCWEAFDRGELPRNKIKSTRFTRLLEHLGKEPQADFISRFGAFYENALGGSAIWVEGAKEFLENAKNRIKIYVVTNGSEEVQKNRFKKVGMDKLVDGIVISESIGAKKPEKEFFDYALKKAGCTDKSKAIIVGDSATSDIAGGKNCGIDTCLFDFRRKYNNIDLGADYTVHNFNELNNLLFDCCFT